MIRFCNVLTEFLAFNVRKVDETALFFDRFYFFNHHFCYCKSFKKIKVDVIADVLVLSLI